eukprot:9474804-Lingulodinium_polyedra.AAC.1
MSGVLTGVRLIDAGPLDARMPSEVRLVDLSKPSKTLLETGVRSGSSGLAFRLGYAKHTLAIFAE